MSNRHGVRFPAGRRGTILHGSRAGGTGDRGLDATDAALHAAQQNRNPTSRL
ncbi:MAG: hypothetical protein AVDCRST_MAG08-4326 [uncultured Acetobacteraceae bacterium]|uniref:Uncharacterized protein n=1 Tax=uncultured Acetobacteraceae bacterium TaxID=169975 RepID=A0A6J4JU59_9PROT|nr:MAG: hypothetical protein AVDCRST_MAG08-4326 [uncultured Acetobacteraceae bacterium]